ncbi:hypothetical protein IAU60_004472 [Kwoniella sp. DSM 27419]
MRAWADSPMLSSRSASLQGGSALVAGRRGGVYSDSRTRRTDDAVASRPQSHSPATRRTAISSKLWAPSEQHDASPAGPTERISKASGSNDDDDQAPDRPRRVLRIKKDKADAPTFAQRQFRLLLRSDPSEPTLQPSSSETETFTAASRAHDIPALADSLAAEPDSARHNDTLTVSVAPTQLRADAPVWVPPTVPSGTVRLQTLRPCAKPWYAPPAHVADPSASALPDPPQLLEPGTIPLPISALPEFALISPVQQTNWQMHDPYFGSQVPLWSAASPFTAPGFAHIQSWPEHVMFEPETISKQESPLPGTPRALSPAKTSVTVTPRPTPFDRSAAPSPELQDVVPEKHAVTEDKFRQWLFPLSPGRPGHAARPSIIRRHTMPERGSRDDPASFGETASKAVPGVASTLAVRVEEFRMGLKRPDGPRVLPPDLPLRHPVMRLADANGSPSFTPSPESPNKGEAAIGSATVSDPGQYGSKLDEILGYIKAQAEATHPPQIPGVSTQQLVEAAHSLDEIIAALRSIPGRMEQHALVITLRAELASSESANARAQAQVDSLNQRLEWAQKDKETAALALEEGHARLMDCLEQLRVADGERATMLKRAVVAEAEGKSLRDAVDAGKSIEEGLRMELKVCKEQLDECRAASTNATAQKDAELAVLRAKLDILDTTRAKDEGCSSAIASLERAAQAMHEGVKQEFHQLDRVIAGHRVGDRPRAATVALDTVLRTEVDRLEEVLNSSTAREAHARSQDRDVKETAKELRIELNEAASSDATRASGFENLQQALAKAEEVQVNLRIIAAERQASIRMQEARLQALAQENIYWRHFALEHDRRLFRLYMASRPLNGLNGRGAGKTGVARAGDGQDEGGSACGAMVASEREGDGGVWYDLARDEPAIAG